MTSTPESITEAELATYYEQRGDVLDPKAAASAAFGVIGATREPEYEPGEIYRDVHGDVFKYCNELAGDTPWLGFTGELYEPSHPAKPLRKMVPEGQHEQAAVLVAEWRRLGERDGAVPPWGDGYRAALRKCADELEYALKSGGSGD